MSKKNTTLLIAIILLVILGAGFYLLKKSKVAKPANQAPVPVTKPYSYSGEGQAPKVTLAPVDKTVLPERFPSDIPLEAGAAIIFNYNAVNVAGQFQASREFVSKKSMADNLSLYQTSLKASGWTITSVSDQPTQKLIFANKGGNYLNIRIYQAVGQVKVSINNLTQP